MHKPGRQADCQFNRENCAAGRAVFTFVSCADGVQCLGLASAGLECYHIKGKISFMVFGRASVKYVMTKICDGIER
jgi:hypothetical protein